MIAEQLLPEVVGEDWMAPVPRMTLFAGLQGEMPTTLAPPALDRVRAIGFVEDDPRMGALNGQWLVGDNQGLKAVSWFKDITPLPVLQGRVQALAVRPRGATLGNPWHVVYTQNPAWPDPDGKAEQHAVLLSCNPDDGTSQIIAGGGEHPPAGGPGAWARQCGSPYAAPAPSRGSPAQPEKGEVRRTWYAAACPFQ